MESRKIAIVVFFLAALHDVMSSKEKESRKVGLLIPEKIIGGVIDIVHNHKNKPSVTQGTYQQNQQGYGQQTYAPQQGHQPYPNQWTQPNYQNQYQNQNQNQNQYQNQYGNYQPVNNYPPTATYPQNNYPVNNGQGQVNQVYPAPVQQGNYGSSQSQSQTQSQGQYVTYPTYPQNAGNQYVSQNENQNQNQNQVQNQNLNQNQQSNGQYGQNQQSNQFQGQNQAVQSTQSTHFQGQGVSESTQGSGGSSGGFQVSGSQQTGGPGPTCVCQAWTKPQNDEQGQSKDNEEKIEN